MSTNTQYSRWIASTCRSRDRTILHSRPNLAGSQPCSELLTIFA
jgi:hypothetical protein